MRRLQSRCEMQALASMDVRLQYPKGGRFLGALQPELGWRLYAFGYISNLQTIVFKIWIKGLRV